MPIKTDDAALNSIVETNPDFPANIRRSPGTYPQIGARARTSASVVAEPVVAKPTIADDLGPAPAIMAPPQPTSGDELSRRSVDQIAADLDSGSDSGDSASDGSQGSNRSAGRNKHAFDAGWGADPEPPASTSRKDHFHEDFPGLGNQVNTPYEGLGA
jgi:hypothetical protein